MSDTPDSSAADEARGPREASGPRIVVVGVGGAGGNAVSNMIRAELAGVEFVVANTDAQAISQSLCETCIQMGRGVTRGLGAGSRPDIGRAAAEEALDEIVDRLEGANMAFITAGMGGGTGTGGAPVVARAAREAGILTVGVVTKPFHFEGVHRMRLAEQGIQELTEYVDTLIIIPNQNLFRVANEKTTFADAFKMADDVLHAGVRGVTDLMVMPGLINLDFADIRTVMTEMGKAIMGTGEAESDGRAIAAAEAAINNPLLDEVSMKGARGVLINITGGLDMTLFEVDQAANRIRDEVDPEANIIFGSTFDQRLEGRMRVSVVATGIDADEEVKARARAVPLSLVVSRSKESRTADSAPSAPPAAAPESPAVGAPTTAEMPAAVPKPEPEVAPRESDTAAKTAETEDAASEVTPAPSPAATATETETPPGGGSEEPVEESRDAPSAPTTEMSAAGAAPQTADWAPAPEAVPHAAPEAAAVETPGETPPEGPGDTSEPTPASGVYGEATPIGLRTGLRGAAAGGAGAARAEAHSVTSTPRGETKAHPAWSRPVGGVERESAPPETEPAAKPWPVFERPAEAPESTGAEVEKARPETTKDETGADAPALEEAAPDEDEDDAEAAPLLKRRGNPLFSWLSGGNAGNAEEFYQKGERYYYGQNVRKNYALALRNYRRAAELGHAAAQNRLGWMYEKGEGAEADNAEAVAWYRRAAEQGHVNAMNDLGYMYRQGWGVPQSHSEALRWFRRAAEKYDSYAEYNMGQMYENGWGVPKDVDEAIRWFRRAAARGHEWATKRLDELGVKT